MDATTLRIILIIVGAAFLIGLYLWERRRSEADADEDWDAPSTNKREPDIGALEDGGARPVSEARPLSEPAAPDAFDPFFQTLEHPGVLAVDPTGNLVFTQHKDRFVQQRNGRTQILNFLPALKL